MGVTATTRRRGHGTATEVIASVDMPVPVTEEDIPYVKKTARFWLSNQGRRKTT